MAENVVQDSPQAEPANFAGEPKPTSISPENGGASTLFSELAASKAEERSSVLFNLLRREYTKRKLPLKGTFELTPHCTLDCKMCYVHSSEGKYPERVLNGDEWIGIMDEAIDAGLLYAGLTGGECFYHPDFWRIYEHLKSRGVFILLLTNGTLIDEEAAKRLHEMPPYVVRLSVYGSCPEVYERVTGSKNAFFKVDRALRLLKEAKVPTDIQLTMSRYNYEDFDALLDYAKSMSFGRINLDSDMFEPVVSSGKRFSDYALSFEEQSRLWQRSIQKNGMETFSLCDEDFIEPLLQGEPEASGSRMPCVAGLCSFTIGYFGNMQPCGQFPLASVNVLKEGFMPAWRQVNDAALSYRRSEECRACAYFGKCRFCPARYALASGGTNGLPGEQPCNKNLRILHTVMREKTRRINE
ncbi:MAG: radical SAM protein [Clostridia bacterium]|nr:radical SAM protein [Clostridia bacterium]